MDDLQLEDHARKCRCCFRILVDVDNTIKITREIEEKFFQLTQIELTSDTAYSSVICELCDRDLKIVYHLKRDLSQKQLRLYELFPIASKSSISFDEQNIIVDTLHDAIERKTTEDEIHVIETEVDLQSFDAASFVSSKKALREQRIETIKMKANPVHDLNSQCNDCGIMLKNSISLKRHVDRIHKRLRNFLCDQCPYTAYFKHSLEQHVVKHIPEEFRDRFLCEFCDFVSISAVNINLHKKYEHGEVKKFYVCCEGDCKKEFARPGQLTAHVRLTHEKIKTKVCPNCKKYFSTTTRLKEHIMAAHSIIPLRDFACEFCPKQFMTLKQLKNHQVYHDEPKFKCELGCDKKFYKPVLLDGHHKTHLSQKDFMCTVCGKNYFLKSHLNRHVASVHTKIKLSCEKCEAKFVRKESLRKHVTTQHHELSNSELETLLRKIRHLKPE